ncbi:MAG: peptide chain release factor N(5)-glutamine methyltransferase [Rhizobiaceae bacterium]|nr:peptide chain release factor N(5)-glutamine methyltransferase [Rhizobiaceae bacterium]
MITLSDMLNEMSQAFEDAGIDGALFESKVLLTGLLGFTTVDVATKRDLELTCDQIDQARAATHQRVKGKPVYRILGWREFYGLKFHLSEATLEPRPDTEILVDVVLPYTEKFTREHGACKIIDLGTGTGAIALSLLHNCARATALGVDQAEDALATAQQNAKNLGLETRFDTLASDWLSNVSDKFHIVVSNPPYISKNELDDLSVEVAAHDPMLALDGGDDGLDAYRILAADIPKILLPSAITGVEIGWQQAEAVTDIFAEQGFSLIAQHKDLAGRDRVLLFEME